MAAQARKRFFYGWIVMAGLFLIALLPMTFVNTFFSYYQVPVCSEFNISYAEFNIANVCCSIGGMLFSLTMATRVTKGNIRIWMLCGGLIGAACYFAMSFITAIWQIYILVLVALFTVSAITYVPINFLISQWFIDKKGLVTSVVFAATGLGGMLFSTTFAGVIENSGWRSAFVVQAAVIAITVIVAFLMVRKSPADMGLEPYKEDKNGNPVAEDVVEKSKDPAELDGFTKGEAIKTVAFWMYAISLLCVGCVSSGIITQLPTYLSINNIDYAIVMAVVSAAMIIGKLLLGPVIDKVGIVNGMLFGCVFGIVGLVVLISVPGVGFVAAVVAAILIPIGTSLASIAPPLVTSALFGYKDFGGIYGLGNTLFMAGCMIGPMLSSGICTVVGSYILAWIVFCVIFALVWFAAFVASRAVKKMQH